MSDWANLGKVKDSIKRMVTWGIGSSLVAAATTEGSQLALNALEYTWHAAQFPEWHEVMWPAAAVATTLSAIYEIATADTNMFNWSIFHRDQMNFTIKPDNKGSLLERLDGLTQKTNEKLKKLNDGAYTKALHNLTNDMAAVYCGTSECAAMSISGKGRDIQNHQLFSATEDIGMKYKIEVGIREGDIIKGTNIPGPAIAYVKAWSKGDGLVSGHFFTQEVAYRKFRLATDGSYQEVKLSELVN